MVVVALGFTPEKEHGIDWWKPFVDIALKEQIVNPGEINDYTKPLNRELAAAIGFRALMKFEEYAYEQWYNYNKAKMDDYNLINDKYKQEVVMACSVNAGRILTTTAGRKLTAFSRSGIDHPV